MLFLSGQLSKTFVGNALLHQEFLFLTFYLHFVLDLNLLELLCLFSSSFSRCLLFKLSSIFKLLSLLLSLSFFLLKLASLLKEQVFFSFLSFSQFCLLLSSFGFVLSVLLFLLLLHDCSSFCVSSLHFLHPALNFSGVSFFFFFVFDF